MKESTMATKVMIGVICAGVLLYLGVYFVLSWREELVTATAYSYTSTVSTQATGLLVRQEVVLQESGSYVDLVLSEGEKAAKGDAIALLYSDPSVLETQRMIKTLEAEIQQLQYALSSGAQGGDLARLDGLVTSSILTLRSMSGSGDLSALESAAMNLRTMVFRRDYTYGNTEASSQLGRLIAQKQSQLGALAQSLRAASLTVYAPTAGVFSGEVDGFEHLVDPGMLSSLTAPELDALLSQPVPDHPSAIGKLITGSRWYLAALIPAESADTLTLNRTYTVSFSHDYYGDVAMRLERMDTEGDQTIAVFSSNTHLSDTTLLRVQTVDVITRQIQGIHIPQRALRVVTDTVTTVDETTGDSHTTQVNRFIVYTIVGAQAEPQEVEVLYTGDDFYLVAPVNQNASHRLRPGDTVIVSSSGMYDGKTNY